MSICLDELIVRLLESLADMEKRNYGDATERLTNTISILTNDGIWAVAKLETIAPESE